MTDHAALRKDGVVCDIAAVTRAAAQTKGVWVSRLNTLNPAIRCCGPFFRLLSVVDVCTFVTRNLDTHDRTSIRSTYLYEKRVRKRRDYLYNDLHKSDEPFTRGIS